MKKKKGFTLIEVVGVLILMGVIAAIAYPIILKHFEDSKEDIKELEKGLIYSQARNYVNSHLDLTRDIEGYTTCIFLKDINEDGSTQIDVSFEDTTMIKLVRNGGDYDISIEDSCTNSEGYSYKTLYYEEEELGNVDIKNSSEYYFTNDILSYEKNYISIISNYVQEDYPEDYYNALTIYSDLYEDLLTRGINVIAKDDSDSLYLTIKKDYIEEFGVTEYPEVYSNATIYKNFELGTSYAVVESFCN